MEHETADEGTAEKTEDESSGRIYDPMAAKLNAEGEGHDEAADPTYADEGEME